MSTKYYWLFSGCFSTDMYIWDDLNVSFLVFFSFTFTFMTTGLWSDFISTPVCFGILYVILKSASKHNIINLVSSLSPGLLCLYNFLDSCWKNVLQTVRGSPHKKVSAYLLGHFCFLFHASSLLLIYNPSYFCVHISNDY